jgi:hypothetical protein
MTQTLRYAYVSRRNGSEYVQSRESAFSNLIRLSPGCGGRIPLAITNGGRIG